MPRYQRAYVAATQRFFLVKNRWWETVAMFVIAFTLFRPDVYRDWLFAPFSVTPVAAMQPVIDGLKPGDNMRLRVEVKE